MAILYIHLEKIFLKDLQPSDDVALFVVIACNSLTFKKYIDNLVRKTQYKLHVLRHITTD